MDDEGCCVFCVALAVVDVEERACGTICFAITGEGLDEVVCRWSRTLEGWLGEEFVYSVDATQAAVEPDT